MGDEGLIVRHAEHFLSRLDRVHTLKADLALSLYRDPDLLRGVLQRAPLPESAERVAISLGDPTRGPFIVVTRDGHFVTCLGEGMTVGELPVVTRGQLDALAQKVVALRERMAEAERLTGGGKRACARLLRRVLVKADAVCQEEFLAVSAWEPMLAPVFMDLYLTIAADLPILAPELRRLKSRSGRAGEALHGYWNLVHAAGHLALLATMGGEQEHYRALSENIPAARAAFSFPLTQTGVARFIVVGAWATGRVGKQLLAAYKQALGEDVALFELFDTIFALLAIGRRTSRLRAEIGKALRAAPGVARTPHARRLREAMGDEVVAVCALADDLLGADDQELDDWLAELCGKLLRPEDGAVDTEVPRELARTLALSLYVDGMKDGRAIARSLSLIGAAARGPAEQFYLPREVLDLVREPWEPAHTELLLAPLREAERVQKRPVVREKRPGPNQPCSCGSGKKYKKCCGSPNRRAPQG